jgi:hypothetical protein
MHGLDSQLADTIQGIEFIVSVGCCNRKLGYRVKLG